MRKRKIVFLVIFAAFAQFFFLIVIMMGLLIIVFSEPKYYEKAGWKVNKEDYIQKYIPFFYDYFQSEFSNKVGIDYFEDTQEEESYYIFYEDSQKNIRITFYTPTTKSYCKFTSKITIFATKELLFEYETIQMYDTILSNFGRKYFYDFSIKECIFKDIFDEHLSNNKNHIWYTSIVGNIESSYSIICNDNVSSIELYVTALIIGFDL